MFAHPQGGEGSFHPLQRQRLPIKEKYGRDIFSRIAFMPNFIKIVSVGISVVGISRERLSGVWKIAEKSVEFAEAEPRAGGKLGERSSSRRVRTYVRNATCRAGERNGTGGIEFSENHLTTIFQRTARTRERQLIFVRKPRLVTSYVHTQMRVLRASRFACQPIEFGVTCVLVSTRPTAASLNLIYPRAKQVLLPSFLHLHFSRRSWNVSCAPPFHTHAYPDYITRTHTHTHTHTPATLRSANTTNHFSLAKTTTRSRQLKRDSFYLSDRGNYLVSSRTRFNKAPSSRNFIESVKLNFPNFLCKFLLVKSHANCNSFSATELSSYEPAVPF